MYRRQVFKEADSKELISKPGRLPQGQTLRTVSERERKIYSTRSVGMVGQTLHDPNIRMVLMWNEYSNQDPNIWISLYDRWHWAAAVESAEIRLGNVRKDHNPLKAIKDIVISFRENWAVAVEGDEIRLGNIRREHHPLKIIRNGVAGFWKQRDPWAAPLVVGEIDPNSSSIMAFSADYRVPTIALKREGSTRAVSSWGRPAEMVAGANFETKFEEIRQSLEKAMS